MNPMGNQMAFDVENAFKGERAALAAVSSGGMLPCLRMVLVTLAINSTLLMVHKLFPLSHTAAGWHLLATSVFCLLPA